MSTTTIRAEAVGTRAKRSASGGETTRGDLSIYRTGGRAKVYIRPGTDEGSASFELERAEAIETAKALLAVFDLDAVIGRKEG